MPKTKQDSRDEAEAPVKTWELTNVQKQVDQHEKMIPRIDTKLDNILNIVQMRPTIEQVDDKVRAAVLSMETSMRNELDKMNLVYTPIINNNKWLLRLVAATTLTTIGSLMLIVVSGLLS